MQSELSRLSSAFGIGVIQLDVGDIDSSTILFPARPKPTLDWETMNKLASQNEDFRTFLDDVVKTSRVKEVNKSKFDRILEDPQEYAASILQGPKAKS